MDRITAHKYTNQILQFLLTKKGDKGEWIPADSFENNDQLVIEYWENFGKVEDDDGQNGENDLIIGSVSIPNPTEIIHNANDADNESYALCKFDDFDTPVYVPTRFLRNTCPRLLIEFFESQIIEKKNLMMSK